LLAVGNGGSAAEAQHLITELVGRYRIDRIPLSAIALHADTSTITAVANDFGFTDVFSRQVRAHGRPGDVIIMLSASGRSANLLWAAAAAQAIGMATWALTGPAPNPLAGACDECVTVAASLTANVQEAHLVAIHIICEGVDAVIELRTAPIDSPKEDVGLL
jgi:phosphoheptose isomerase